MTPAGLPHETLGVAANATSDEIRNAYRLIAIRHHPDGTSGHADPHRFRDASAAYQALVKGISAANGISNRRALDLFDEAMHELAAELARMGYDEVYIYRALSEDGCPADVATSAARAATSSAPRQRERAAAAWRFPQAGPMPVLETAPRSGLGFGMKMLALGLFLCTSLAATAWLVPDILERAREATAPLRAITLPSVATPAQDAPPAAWTPAPAPGIAPVELAPAKPRVVQPRPAPQRGADSCTTDRDCPSGQRCSRAGIHDAWSCVPR
jgi:hypothetical protein